MKVPLLDLKLQYRNIKHEINKAIQPVLESQQFILGPEVESFERALAEYVGTRHGVGVASGTDALLISLMALGIGPGDEVIVPSYTFFATGGCVARLGAKPVFADIDPDTYNIAPDSLESAVTKRTKAVIPVHLYGQCCDMARVLEIAGQHDIFVVEDAAQAIGAGHPGGKAGALGIAGCFSFFPAKNLGAFGDGGMVVTNDDELADKLRVLRVHGSKPKYHHKTVGGNFRLDALQAAILNVKLKHLDDWTAARRANADDYDRLFVESGLVPSKVKLPARVLDGHVFNQYVIAVDQRDRLREFLLKKGVGTEIYYPVPLHLQECFAGLACAKRRFPVSERSAATSLALPVYPELTLEQKTYVVATIAEFYE